MKDKNIVDKLHLYANIEDKSILSYSAKRMNRYLTKDEVFLVGCAEKNMKITEAIGLMRDEKYVISLLNELMEKGVIKDKSGVLSVGNASVVKSEQKPNQVIEVEDESDTMFTPTYDMDLCKRYGITLPIINTNLLYYAMWKFCRRLTNDEWYLLATLSTGGKIQDIAKVFQSNEYVKELLKIFVSKGVIVNVKGNFVVKKPTLSPSYLKSYRENLFNMATFIFSFDPAHNEWMDLKTKNTILEDMRWDKNVAEAREDEKNYGLGDLDDEELQPIDNEAQKQEFLKHLSDVSKKITEILKN